VVASVLAQYIANQLNTNIADDGDTETLLSNLQAAIKSSNLVDSVNGETGAVVLGANDVGAYSTSQSDEKYFQAVGGNVGLNGVISAGDIKANGSNIIAEQGAAGGGYYIQNNLGVNIALISANSAGVLTIQSLVSGGSITLSNNINTGGTLTTTGALSSNSTVHANSTISAGGNVTATGAISAGTTITANGAISSGGNLSANGTISTPQNITAYGPISSGQNITATGSISSGGEISSGGILSEAGQRVYSPNNPPPSGAPVNTTGIIGQSGWFRDGSTGLITQWGYLGTSNGTYNFPVTFPNACLNFMASNTNSAGTNVDNAFGYPNNNVTFFAGTKSSSIQNDVTNYSLYWTAIGY
jgi:hypothetical protein